MKYLPYYTIAVAFLEFTFTELSIPSRVSFHLYQVVYVGAILISRGFCTARITPVFLSKISCILLTY